MHVVSLVVLGIPAKKRSVKFKCRRFNIKKLLYGYCLTCISKENSYDMSVKHRTYLYKYPQGGDISKGDCSFIEVMRFLDNVWLKLCHSLQSRVMSSLQAHCAFQLSKT